MLNYMKRATKTSDEQDISQIPMMAVCLKASNKVLWPVLNSTVTSKMNIRLEQTGCALDLCVRQEV